MKIFFSLIFIVLSTNSYAKDIALILSEEEQKDLVQVLDSSVRNGGLGIATQASHIWEKMKLAPVVTPQNPEPATSSTTSTLDK